MESYRLWHQWRSQNFLTGCVAYSGVARNLFVCFVWGGRSEGPRRPDGEAEGVERDGDGVSLSSDDY